MRLGLCVALMLGLIGAVPANAAGTGAAGTGAAGMAAAATGAAGTGAAAPDLKIGLLLDMTGPYAQLTGIGSATAARMAAADFGGSVLGRKIDIVIADHHDDANLAAEIARRWFDTEGVTAIADVADSSPALAVQAIGRSRGRIVMLSAPGALRLSNEACSPTSVHYVYDTYSIAHTLAPALVARGGDSWFFITADYSFGYDLEHDTAAVVKAAGGHVLGNALAPLGATDFTSYLLRAQHSGAKIVALADAGADALHAVERAHALGIGTHPQNPPGADPGQTIAALQFRIDDVHALGLAAAQGMIVSEPFYWNLDNATRAWSQRFFAKVGKMPNSLQAGVYSSTMHYLQAVRTAGTVASGPVMQAMRQAPIHDFFAADGHIRQDGVMIHDMYLFAVKTPAESHGPWDLYRKIATIPGDEAFQPLSQSRCPFVHH